MTRAVSISVYFALAIFPACCSYLQATAADKKIQGNETTAAWILEPKQGRIFASVQSSNEVVEYNLEGQEVRRFKVGKTPTKMAIKNNTLNVICLTDKSVWSIDLKNNKKPIRTQLDAFPQNVFCSKASNDFIYCVCTKTESRSGFSIKQIDLSSLTVRNSLDVNRWGQSWPINVAMSYDGKWIVPDGRGQTSPSGADLMRVNEEKFTFEQIKDYHDSFGQIVAGPSSRYWALGNKLYSADLVDLNRTFNGQLVAFHPLLDLVAVSTDDKIEFQSFSNTKSFGSTELSVKSTAQTAPKRKLSSSAIRAKKREELKQSHCLMFDETGKYLVYGRKTVCHIIALANHAVDAEDLLMISVPSSVKTLAGEAVRIPVELTNPKLETSTKFSLADAPKGAMLIDGTITWTPSAADIGNQIFKVRATSGVQTDSVQVTVSVESPRIELNFHPRGVSFDLDGQYAFAWGYKQTPEEMRSGRFNSSEQSTDMVAVIDLAKRKILVSKTLAAGVQAATVSGKYIFLLTKSGSVLYRFDLETLGNSKRRFLKGRPQSLFNYSKNEIAVVTDNSPTEPFFVFDTEKFELTKTPILGHQSFSYLNNSMPLNSRISENLIDNGTKIVDLDGVTQVIKTSGGLPFLSMAKSRNQQSGYASGFLGQSSTTFRFGRLVNGSQLVSSSNSVIKSFQTSGSRSAKHQISPFAPVMFGLNERSNGKRYDSDVSTLLEMRSLVDGSLLESQTIDVQKRNSNGYRRHILNTPTINIFKEYVYVIRHTNLYAIPIPKSALEKAQMPLHFQLKKFKPLGVENVEKIQLATLGESSELKFELLKEIYPGVEIDETSGEISIDTPRMWRTFLRNLTNKQFPFMGSPNSSFMQNKDHSKKSKADTYFELTGEPLPKDKLPFVLPIDVAVSDEEGQEDRLHCFVLVLAPKSDVEKVEKEKLAEMEKRRAEIERQRAEQRALAQKRNEELMKRREREQAEKANQDDSRLDELENRVRRIEAVLDTILQKMEKLQSVKDK